MLSRLSPDGRLILLTTTLRSFAVGFVSVLLGLYLAETGFDAGKVGALLAAVLAGNTISTTIASLFADSFGRRRSFIVLSCMTIAGGILYPLTDSFALLMVIGAFAGFGLGGKDRGPECFGTARSLASSRPDAQDDPLRLLQYDRWARRRRWSVVQQLPCGAG